MTTVVENSGGQSIICLCRIGPLYQRAMNVVADLGKPAAVKELAKKMSEHGTSIDLDAYNIKAIA